MAGKNVVLEIDAFEMNKAPQNDDDILLRIIPIRRKGEL
jgi:hypothetical protein